MFTSILCPVDFSEHSEVALGYAIDLATLTGGHLTIVTVVDPLLDAAANASGSHEALNAQTQREISDLLARINARRNRPHEQPAIAVAVGDPGDEILLQARECGADLIVMGRQGVSAAERLVFGSVTARVLKESKVPVLAVPLPK